ncbi:MAG TPA: TIGR03619 family F420-dependent LLM class oxidoreductase [Nitrososphaerales archaeon]|nr:TIGR03619 family F420-dependent LLM class oxidoreductase [Nitrososphaerales archaeon]
MIKLGVCVPNYGSTLSVDTLREVALEAERLGYDSLWTTDHILVPKRSGTPYEVIFDSITTLGYLAAQTKKVKLGISSLIIALRNPLVAAKQLATLDGLSSGRLSIFAIGAGWLEKEFSFLGSDFHTRGRRVDESIRLIRALWAGEENFQSKTIAQNFSDYSFEPRPKQRDMGLNIWIGGTSIAAMKRAADLGDAWHPNVSPIDSFRELVSQFRQASPNAKEKPICVRIGLNSSATQSEYKGPRGDRRVMLSGNMEENKLIISELEKLGVSYALVVTSPDGMAPLENQLEGLRMLAKELL